LRAIIEDVKAAGITSVRAIADELTHRAILHAPWRAVACYVGGPTDGASRGLREPSRPLKDQA
jgi:hypothetical protein